MQCHVTQAGKSNITRARALYELALEADPQHLQSLLGLGSLEARAGSVDRGLRLLREGLRLEPDNKQFRHMIAQWQRKHGERGVSFVPACPACRYMLCTKTSGQVCMLSTPAILHGAKFETQTRCFYRNALSVCMFAFCLLFGLPLCLPPCLSLSVCLSA